MWKGKEWERADMATQKSQQKSQKGKQAEASKVITEVEEQQSLEEAQQKTVDDPEKVVESQLVESRVVESRVVESRLIGAAGLSVLLGQMVAYFTGRASADDIDVLTFSLHHLFCRVDYLYCSALPELMHAKTVAQGEPAFLGEMVRRQFSWNTLRSIREAVNRMEPLCHLLNNAVEDILDALDQSGHAASPAERGSEKAESSVAMPESGHDWLQSLNQKRWNHALVTLTEQLGCWQRSYNELAPFVNQFANIIATVPSLVHLDGAFSVLLDCAGAIFGDILPSSQAISVADDDAVVTLLFDLMQQSDQMLVQFDSMLEPLHALLEYFAPGTNR
jgi:hypothetical protein